MTKDHKKILQEIAGELKALSGKLEKLLTSVDAHESKPSKPVIQKSDTKTGKAKPKAAEKEVVKETPKPVKQAPDGAEQVLMIIKKAGKSVDIATLKKKTGFDSKTINDILDKLNKEKKIKRLSKGLYTKV